MHRLLALAFLLAASTSAAHGDEDHTRPAKKKAAPAVSAPAGHADGDHEHESPHGGLVATVDKDVHVEVLFTDADVHVWFYDADMKPVALPTDAKATVVVGKGVKKLELPVAKNTDGTAADHLGAPLTTVKHEKLSIVIQATVIGKARSARIQRAPVPALK